MFQGKDMQARAGPCHSQDHGFDRLNNKTKQNTQLPSHVQVFIKCLICALCTLQIVLTTL